MIEKMFPNGPPLVELTQPKAKYPWTVKRDFVYFWRGKNYVCPEGYETDFLSVPRFLWSILNPTGPGAWGSLIHDILYSSEMLPREQTDRIFLSAMLDSECDIFRANTMFRAVRVFGGATWLKHNPEEVSEDLVTVVRAMERWN